MLSKCYIFEQAQLIGLGNNNRKWIVDMKKEMQLYLNMYFNIDCIGYLIQNANMNYISCKYWYFLMTHTKALAVVVAHDMYLEFAEGELNESWNIRETMIYWECRENLSDQMLTYKPISSIYRGDSIYQVDENMRVYVAQILKQQNICRTNN